MNIKTSIIKKPIIGALFFASSIIAPIVYAATPFIPQPIIQLPIIPPPIITIPSAPVVPPVAPNPPIDHDKFLQFAESNRSDTVDSFNNAGSLLAKGSATAYYEAIDPLNQKTTINDWKTLNGFIEPLPSTAAGLASMGITHAVYRNATDLGFVRNIYMRVKPNGDVVALLENFASFDRTLKRSTDEVNDSCTTAFNGTLPEAQQCTSGGIAAYESRDLSGMLAAVVMEYSAGTTGGAKFTQFYGYVNKVNGVTDVNNASRVAALDLTGRGKAEAFPGLCATCHGGTPGGIDANGVGDL